MPAEPGDRVAEVAHDLFMEDGFGHVGLPVQRIEVAVVQIGW
jgi:hypothetical protein